MKEDLIPTGKLIERMMAEASRPATMKGGAGQRLRMQQDLMRQAAVRLARWGRPEGSRKAQRNDLFAPAQQAAE